MKTAHTKWRTREKSISNWCVCNESCRCGWGDSARAHTGHVRTFPPLQTVPVLCVVLLHCNAIQLSRAARPSATQCTRMPRHAAACAPAWDAHVCVKERVAFLSFACLCYAPLRFYVVDNAHIYYVTCYCLAELLLLNHTNLITKYIHIITIAIT